MANNCLQKKLKSTVQNSNLTKLGSFLVYVYPETSVDYSKRYVSFAGYEPIIAKVISGDLYFTNSTGSSNEGTEKTGNTLNLFLSNHSGVIEISNKYAVAMINFDANWGEYLHIPVENLDYIANSSPQFSLTRGTRKFVGDMSNVHINVPITNFMVMNSALTGDINHLNFTDYLQIRGTDLRLSLGSLKNIKTVDATNCKNLSGQLSDIASPYLVNITIGGSGITGAVEDLYTKLWSLNKRTGNAGISCIAPITFHGQPINTTTIYTGTFDANGVSVSVNSNVVASYNGSTWTYA